MSTIPSLIEVLRAEVDALVTELMLLRQQQIDMRADGMSSATCGVVFAKQSSVQSLIHKTNYAIDTLVELEMMRKGVIVTVGVAL